MELKNIMAIDGSYCLHRSLKQPNLWEFRNKLGERTGGIFGFLNILQKEIRLVGNYYPIICWDDGQSDRRLSVYDNYKRHREKMEDPEYKPLNEMSDKELDEDYVYNYKLQRKKLIRFLNACGIPNLFFHHTEGDDLLCWLSKHSKKCKVVTDDKDMLQLLSETTIVRRPMADKVIQLDQFLQDNNFTDISDFVKQKALCGDASDNIPGACFKVGEKSSVDCIKLYETLKEQDKFETLAKMDDKTLKVLCNDLGIKYKSAYRNFDRNQYEINLELVDLNRIKPGELNDEAIYDTIRNTYKNSDLKEPFRLLHNWEIKTIDLNIIFEALVMNRHNIKESK